MGKRIPFFLGFVLLAIALWVQITSYSPVVRFINRLENLAYDMQLRTKLLTQPNLKQDNVVIVDIDDKSLSQLGRWPWDREKVAELIHQIQQDGAVVIALDTLFPEKEENIADKVLAEINNEKLFNPELGALFKKIQPFFDNDARLAKSLIGTDVVLGFSFVPYSAAEGALSAPILTLTSDEEKQLGFIRAPGYLGNVADYMQNAKSSGFVNVFPDDDGIVRRVPLLINYKGTLYPSLALDAARLYLLENINLVTANYDHQLRLEGVKLGDHIIPTDARAQVIVPFRGKSFSFPYFSAIDVLNKKIPANSFDGKIVFVGTSATGLGDLKATAVQNIFPGVEVQATIANGILNNYFSYKPAWAQGFEFFITLVLGLIAIFTFPYFGPRILSLVIVIVPICLLFANNWLWSRTGLIISVFIPICLTALLAIMNMIYGYLFETRKREKLKEMFGQYVPEKHIDEMLTSSGNYGLYGEDRDMTVLFADIRNFTTISEPLTAAQLKELLNDFFTPMTEIIFKHRGTIDKYVGDMIMAFWGAPLKDKRHALHAVSAALEMQTTVEKLKPVLAAKGHAEINIGIGINSGIMSVGDMGSLFRRNYTVLGDAVNLASRIEGLTKFYGAKIIVTENTLAHEKLFVARKLDRVRVKGKQFGVEIYEILCRQTDLTDDLRIELEQYHQALVHYFKQEWVPAKVLLAALEQKHPDIKVYSLYLHRIAEFEINPPPADWDGIYIHTNK